MYLAIWSHTFVPLKNTKYENVFEKKWTSLRDTTENKVSMLLSNLQTEAQLGSKSSKSKANQSAS